MPPIPKSLVGHQSGVYALAFDPSGSHLASGEYDGQICLWDTQAGSLIRVLHPHINDLKNIYGIFGMEFSPDGLLLAACILQKPATLKVWEVKSGIERFAVPVDELTSFAWHPSGELLACGSVNGLSIRDARTGAETRLLTDLRVAVTSVGWSHEPQFLVGGSCYDAPAIGVWDASRLNLLAYILSLGGEAGNVQQIGFTSNRALMWTEGYGRIYGATLPIGEAQLLFKPPVPLQAHIGYSTAFDARTLTIAYVSRHDTDDSYNSVIHIYDIEMSKEICELPTNIEEIGPIRFSPNGQLLATADMDGKLLLWDLSSTEQESH